MLIKLKKTKRIKKIINPLFMEGFFNERLKKYFPGAHRLIDFKIEILRNFLGKFRNLSVKYTLRIDFGDKKITKVIIGKANSRHETPRRWYLVAKHLRKRTFSRSVPLVLEYYPELNLTLYEEVDGLSFQELLAKKKVDLVIENVPQIAHWLAKFHRQANHLSYLVPTKDEKQEKREYRHWFFLMRKCFPPYLNWFKKIFNQFIKIKKENSSLFLSVKFYIPIHGDFHLGNVLLAQKDIKIVDFGDVYNFDPLNDLAIFLAQTNSMLRYYTPRRFLANYQKIKNTFLRNYFSKTKKPDLKKKFRIKFYETKTFFQMAAILAFTADKKSKRKAIKKMLRLAEKRLNELKEITHEIKRKKIH